MQAHGKPCWVDLTTSDPDGADEFYRKLLGWEVRRSDTPMGTYLIAVVDDREVAGMMAQAPDAVGAPPMWTVYIWVDDIDAVVANVPTAGGSVVAAPFDIPGGAHVSIVADPSGAVLGLMAGGETPEPLFSMAPGAVGWIELMAHDTAGAMRFYRDVFGWNATTSDANGIDYTVFDVDGTQVAGMIPTPAELADDVPDSWSVYFNVADCAATVAAVRDHDGQVLKGATPTPMGPFAVIADPQGAVFQIMEFTGPPG